MSLEKVKKKKETPSQKSLPFKFAAKLLFPPVRIIASIPGCPMAQVKTAVSGHFYYQD